MKRKFLSKIDGLLHAGITQLVPISQIGPSPENGNK